MENGVTINSPERWKNGVCEVPDNISVEILQAGGALEIKEPGLLWKILGTGRNKDVTKYFKKISHLNWK